MPEKFDADSVPPARTGLLIVATILLLAPLVALLWVGSYAKAEPAVAGFPIFIWYQFLWVFICSATTWLAYRLVLIARPRRSGPGTGASR